MNERFVAIVFATACSSGAGPAPAVGTPITPRAEARATPAQPADAALAPLPARDRNVELVAKCATEAVELLGWNPLPDGAHRGMAMKTAQQHGGSKECQVLATKENKWHFEIGGDVIEWDWEPKDQADATTIRFAYSCKGCTTIETQVELPRRWHCFAWVHGPRNGSGCHPSHAECEESRATHHSTTPCTLRTGAAWCLRSAKTICFESPWACTRGPCDRDPPL